MQRPNFYNRLAGDSAFSREDTCPSEADSVLPTPDDSMPGSIWQAVGQESMPTSGPSSASDYPREHGLGSARHPERPTLGTPLGLRTMNTSMPIAEISYRDQTGTDSPTQQLQFLPNPPFPVLRHNSSEDYTSSPKTERLPSFRQLSKIADGGTEGTDVRITSYPALPAHSQGMVSQSPGKALPYFTGNQQPSPTASFSMLNHPSPPGARADGQEAFAVPPSPGRYAIPDHSRYAQRRQSFGAAKGPPTFAPSLTSSSNETNISHQSSGGESYATSSTTPNEHPGMEASQHGPLAMPSGMQQSPPAVGIFTCEFPGCTAAPFQTQYLLNSHANVHSSNRPHFCPVKGCPRSEGGKGFKRKNEMIRHGLVHDSPGYICPFCPLREHKYPRPDNLQRHVRVHHVDKDKDDPLLREVLSQRPEGGSRGRRRRTGP